ncbi:MAG: UDP-N-acetylmuramoylalanine--D-glutamate ligase [Methanobrevibacter sp.]|jgi:UDP-N-acetylmuramoylalanine--D-glutamate ligase|nr:UDP-N-acetylmuramoylalanine--D-glutamate ligase [Candidatus Methanoflexus mossambicus]
MKATVFGLGVEGKEAVKSLLKYGWDVYAHDSNLNIDLNEFKFDNLDDNLNNLEIDLGNLDQKKVDDSDAILISPGLYNLDDFKIYRTDKYKSKLISNVLTKHKDIYTIAITGTNGKTTTATMLKDILSCGGKSVLIGGNAGGGFNGYLDLILNAEYAYDSQNSYDTYENYNNYDYMIVEVCDMTIEFANDFFDIDLVGLTNIGNDHLNHHKSIENYKNTVKNVFKDKNIFLNSDDNFINEYKQFLNNNQIDLDKLHNYEYYDGNLNVLGKFNRYNASLAESIAKYLNINETTINISLKNFKSVEGRLNVFKSHYLNNELNDRKVNNEEFNNEEFNNEEDKLNDYFDVYIGKTDNSHAIKAILDEKDFDILFIGTPRDNETFRLDILNEIVLNHNFRYNTKDTNIILFNGLSDNFKPAINRLNEINYMGNVKIAKNIDEIINYVQEYRKSKNNFTNHKNKAIFIGGNGQENIKKIQDIFNDFSCN